MRPVELHNPRLPVIAMKPEMTFMHFFGVALGGRVLRPNTMLPLTPLRTLLLFSLTFTYLVSLFVTRLHSAYI